MNKKAQSEIITTVLIILLVIAAVVIVWQVISNTLNTTSDDINTGSACFDAAISVAKATNASTNNLVITREGGGPAKALTYAVYINGAVTAFTASNSTLTTFASTNGTVTGLKVGDKVAVALTDGTAICGSKSAEITAIGV